MWMSPLEIVFQEQSYCSLHSEQSLALSGWYCQSLRRWSQFLRSYCRSLRHYPRTLWSCRDPWGDRGSSVADATTLIIARLPKHHETLVKHCDTLCNTRKTSWTTSKTLSTTSKTSWTTSKTSWNTSKTSWNTLKTLWNIMKHSNTRHSMRWHQRSMRRHWSLAGRYGCSRRVSGDIGDCGVGITLQMCNRVTNHGDMGIYSRPGRWRTNFKCVTLAQFSS